MKNLFKYINKQPEIEIMRTAKFFLIIVIAALSISCNKTKEFPVTDLHIHLKGNFTLDDAVKKSAAENINYGIAFNCGIISRSTVISQIDLGCKI